MRIVYAGTPEFAVPALKALCATEHEIIAVYTQPDRRAGRGRKVTAGPVKACATQNAITVLQPPRFDAAAIEEFVALEADLAVVAAYGLLLPPDVLESPNLGCVNIHASLLPRWRGAAPIARAIEHGDAISGITLMQMDEGLDTGAILAQSEVPLDSRVDATGLHDQLADLGATLLIDKLDAIGARSLSPQQQADAQSCYARKLDKKEADIDWRQSAVTIDRKVRAFTGWPVASTGYAQETWKIWQAAPVDHPQAEPGEIVRVDDGGIVVACGEGCLAITELQKPGGRRLDCETFLRGLREHRPRPGARFMRTTIDG